MKASDVEYGNVNPDDVVAVTLISQTPEDKALLTSLVGMCKYTYRSDADRLALIVLGCHEKTPLLMLIDEVSADIAADDAGAKFVNRATLINALKDAAAVLRNCVPSELMNSHYGIDGAKRLMRDEIAKVAKLLVKTKKG